MKYGKEVELPLPCDHASSKWAYRISSHEDSLAVPRLEAFSFCSVWVCAKPECVDRGKRYVAHRTLRTPLVIDGKTHQVVSV